MGRVELKSTRFSVPTRGFSLRTKALAVIVALLSMPLILVYLSVIGDTSVQRQLEDSLTVAAVEIEGVYDTDARNQVARNHAVWMRVLDPDGNILENQDYESDIGGWFSQLFFGAAGAPTHAEYDATLPPLSTREYMNSAPFGDTTCSRNASGMLLVCTVVVVQEVSPELTLRVVLQTSSRRAIRALYDVRILLLKLTLATLLVSTPVIYLFVTRLLTPIEELREAMSSRAASPQTATLVSLEHDDELGDLALAFNELLRQLDQRNQDYERFVADLAHELKNPVAAVRAVSESMSSPREVSSDRLARWSRVLGESGKKLDTLVSKFLELARAESGQVEDRIEQFALNALVEGVVSSVSSGGLYEGVHFRTNIEVCQVSGSISRIETAIRNVVENAASFVDPQNGNVALTLRTEDEMGVLFIDDDGPGIPSNVGEKVFERFFTTRPTQGGTGLGLAFTRAAIASHGGSVAVDTSPLGGTRIVLSLPIII